jgi:hypothetical protein
MVTEPEDYQYQCPVGEPATTPPAHKLSSKKQFAATRRAVVFLLGVVVIIDAFFQSSHVIAQLIIGTVLVGVLPIDDFLDAIRPRRR